jgi:uncharacterized protein with gpF-like domain
MTYNVSQKDRDKAVTRDHALKLAFELVIAEKLEKEFNTFVKEFEKSIKRFNHPPSTIEHRENIKNILLKHYDDVSAKFSKQIVDELGIPNENDQIQQTINFRTSIHNILRADRNAYRIAITTQKNIHDSLVKAVMAAATAGIVLTREKLAEDAAFLLKNTLQNRIETISISETQNPAEHAKFSEIQALESHSANFPRIEEPINIKKKEKMWRAVLDSRTRITHAEADGQVVEFGRPFTVGGEKLRFPGDDGLGASIANTINCRCSSIIIVY